MGVYLSQPTTDKVSTDDMSERLIVGASSMQGWRKSQEDAHNAIINFDKNTSLFAVYDGHGGAEVAVYCADCLPEFLKEHDLYKQGRFEDALRDVFLEFDRTLLNPEVVEVLKAIAGDRNVEDSDGMEYEEDDEDLVELHEESNLPLNELLEKYKGHPSMPSLNKLRSEAGGSSGSTAGGSKPQSPYLRGRRTAAIVAQATNKALMESNPQGSSTSAAALAAHSSGAKPSSLFAKKSSNEPVDDTTVSSSSCSSSSVGSESGRANNINSNNSNNNTPNHDDGTLNTNGIGTSTLPEAAVASKPDSSHPNQETGQNGSVTSSEAKAIISSEAVCSKPAADQSKISGSNDDASSVVLKKNGSVDSSTTDNDVSNITSIKTDGATISSTTNKEARTSNVILDTSGNSEEDEDDAEYQYDTSYERSSEDEIEENEEEEDEAGNEEDDENGSEAESDEFDEDGDEQEDDDESNMANQQFCANMIQEPGKDSGCTAVVALLHGRDLYVANAGDSRCVVCRDGTAIEMSLDHKPEDEAESARILRAGGRVTLDGRVNGGLNLSRAIGDHAYKMNAELPFEEQMISARPDIKKLTITPEDEFMVLACDGIWNSMSSEEVVDFVRERINKEKISEICGELFDHCLAPNTMGDGTGCDNMTAVIVRFRPKLLDPTETEDNLIKLKSDAAEIDNDEDVNLQKKAQKRKASPSNNADHDDENTNEAEQLSKTKRLKTDNDESDPSQMEVKPCNDSLKQADHIEKNNCNTTTTTATTTATETSDNADSPAAQVTLDRYPQRTQ